MADHTIEAHFVIKAGATGVPDYLIPPPPPGLPAGPIWTLHFDGYDVSAWGTIVIKRLQFGEK
jgi:hypothetical protein